MPRPRKCRLVWKLPENDGFVPISGRISSPIILTVDEYEVIRLIDKEDYSQEQCGEYMKIARTTVQLIYRSARQKLACALVDGRPLRIEGGQYELREEKDMCPGCVCPMCHRRGCPGCVKKEETE